jgi:hypothetical protein
MLPAPGGLRPRTVTYTVLVLYLTILNDVNETLGPETATFGFLPETLQKFSETFDLGLETSTETFRDRDVFSRPFRRTVSLYYNNRYI